VSIIDDSSGAFFEETHPRRLLLATQSLFLCPRLVSHPQPPGHRWKWRVFLRRRASRDCCPI